MSILGTKGINTHFYDGKLKNVMGPFIKDLERISKISCLQKTPMFIALLNKILSTKTTANTKIALNTLVKTHTQIDHGDKCSIRNPNYDPKNNLHACDLLYLICEKIQNSDKEDSLEYFNLLLTQLNDMMSGMCAQGRTTRLAQVLVMLEKE